MCLPPSPTSDFIKKSFILTNSKGLVKELQDQIKELNLKITTLQSSEKKLKQYIHIINTTYKIPYTTIV